MYLAHIHIKNKIVGSDQVIDKASLMGSVGEMGVILQRFGDEESTLFDQYERLSFEVQLNQAILGRSLSEPSTLSSRKRAALVSVVPPSQSQVKHQVSVAAGGGASGSSGGGGRRRRLGLHKVFQKLLKPILGRAARKDVRDHQKEIKRWKNFSRSFRY